MSHTFADRLAIYMKASDVALADWVIILPSERAKKYIQAALFKQYGKAIFSPQFFTIDQWVRSLSPQVVLNKTRLLMKLYHIHVNYPDEKLDKDFDEFLNWGNMLLQDFDEIERYLVDPRLLFRNLRDIKEIENWSFGEDKILSENQQKYLAFWERLPHYYEQLMAELKAQGTCMMGSVYKQLSSEIDLVFAGQKQVHFLFAGFNALSLAEMTLFRQLHRLGRGHIMLDSDRYYVEDPNHEAGLFIRRLRDFIGVKELPELGNQIRTGPKKIELVSCAQATGQVKIAADKLAQLSPEEINETLVLLADESLILALLQNIPKSVQRANISLGLPLKFTALKTWLSLVFNIQEGFLRHGRVTVYYKDLLQFWNHPFFQETLTADERQLIHQKERDIRSRNILFQSLNKITVSPKVDHLLQLLYTPWENDWSKALNLIRRLNLQLYESLASTKEYERAIMQQFDNSLIDFEQVVQDNFPQMNLRSFKLLFNQEWARVSIAYYGNPIAGLQIMGLLESRLLDFKRIIALGMNEGKMPPNNQIQSLIPMDLRSFVGLPTPRDKQGLFAHHFYRLLHHAEELICTYHEGAEGIGFAEKSRFIAQIELELGQQNPQIEIVKRDYTLNQDQSLAAQSGEPKSILKTPEIETRLDELFAKGTSVSMLKNYLRCPLDFYYKYVLHFGEEEKIEEELESNTFGTIIHEVLEELYQPFNQEKQAEGQQAPALGVQAMDQMLNTFEPLLYKGFTKHFNGDESAFQTGKNFLSYSMSIELTKRYLQSEKAFLKNNPTTDLRIKGLETRLEHQMEVEVYGQMKTINLKGFVDRIDLIDGEIRIVDYKTGKVAQADVGQTTSRFVGTEIEYLTQLTKKSKHFFQLLTYVYLYRANFGVLPKESAIVSFVSYQDNPYVMHALEYSYAEMVEHYPAILSALLEEIYDPIEPFVHTTKEPEARYCGYCN